jgi:hypothetical protein
MIQFIKDWWYTGFILFIPFWATKKDDQTWPSHMTESLFVLAVLAVFLVFLFWISATFLEA